MKTTYYYKCSCGKTLRIYEGKVGKKARCSACGKSFTAHRERISPLPDDPNGLSELSAATRPQESEALSLKPGSVIFDSYVLGRLLGEGGMGKVFEVHLQNWDVTMVVKIPKATLVSDAASVFKFEQECNTWVGLGLHPHIVECHFVRRLDGVPLVFAELVSGGSLSSWIHTGHLYRGDENRSLRRILDLSIQMAWGLHFSHQSGLVHQDVKPANFMLTKDRTAKVTDFGLARAGTIEPRTKRAGERNILVSAGGMTPAYCSPEQAKGEALSHKTDIWSWGLSVLEMFVGSVSWPAGQIALEVLKEYVRTNSASHSKGPGMPGSIVELLQECFRYEPEERPADFDRITKRLREIYQETTGRSYPREEPPSTHQVGDALQVGSLNNRAISMVELGRLDEAYTYLTEAEFTAKAFEGLEATADLQEIAYNRCLIQTKSNALYDVRAVAGQIPSAPDPLKHAYFVGMLLLEGGEIHLAVDFLTPPATEDSPLREKALNARGIALLLVGESRPAILSFRAAIRLGGDRIEVRRNLALAYYYDGQVGRAFRNYETIAARTVSDSLDFVRFATVLSAVGMSRRAGELVRSLARAPDPGEAELLCIAELATGAQTFLLYIGRVPLEHIYPQALAAQALEKNRLNLRAHVDYLSFPQRYGLKPIAKVRNRERLRPSPENAHEAGNYVAASYRAFTRRARWGQLHSSRARLQCMAVSAVIPLIVAAYGFNYVGKRAMLAEAFGPNDRIAGLALRISVALVVFSVITRAIARKAIFYEAVFSYMAAPFIVYLPTMAHHLYISTFQGKPVHLIAESHLHLLVALSLGLPAIFLSREIVYRWLSCRVRAFGGGWIHVHRPRNEKPRESNANSTPKVAWYSLVLFRMRSFPNRTLPRITRALRNLSVSFGAWQLFLLPEFLTMAVMDSLWMATYSPMEIAVYFSIMLVAHGMILIYGAIVPRLFLYGNFALIVFVSIGFGVELARSAPLGAIALAVGVWGVFSLLNWLAIGRCPGLADEWDTCKIARWDATTMIDPLDIRQYAAPWQLIRVTRDNGTSQR